jgi:Arc/MetJ family transcription regulator
MNRPDFASSASVPMASGPSSNPFFPARKMYLLCWMTLAFVATRVELVMHTRPLLRDPNDRSGPHDTPPPNRVSPVSQCDAQKDPRMVYNNSMRTNIDINESLVRKARKLTRLKTKRQIVDKALQLLVRSESRKGILRYYGSGIWKGDPKAMRRNRA